MKVQIILAGIGGQGILFASKVLSELGLKLGLDVMGSETHGMSQRGGSVTAHLKLGGYQSPMIRAGTADILFAFEGNEAYKGLRFLKRKGLCILNLETIDLFNSTVLKYMKEKEVIIKAYDASGKALKIGSVRSANILLLGFSVGTGLVPFKHMDLIEVIGTVSKQNDRQINLKAFEIGVQDGKQTNIAI